MVTKEIAFPVGVPPPVAVRLGIMAFTAAGRGAEFLTFTDPLFSLLSSAAYRSTVAGKSQMFRVDQPLTDGKVQELLLIKTEDEGKGLSGLNCQRSSKGRRLEAMLEESQGVLSPFFFPLGVFLLGKRSLGERLFVASFQMREKKS